MRPVVFIASLVLLVTIAACVEPIPSDAASLEADYTIVFSTSTDRSNATALDARTVSGEVYVFVEPDEDIDRVIFSIDGVEVQVENNGPFDLGGTDSTGMPYAYDALTEGEHALAADLLMANGSTRMLSAAFTFESEPGSSELLAWSPPTLSNPTTIEVSASPSVIRLDTSRDYRLVFPNEPVTKAVAITGGRNVVLVGGEIAIPDQGSDPTINERRGLYLTGATGTVHIEGLLIAGDDLSEGIQINAPDATIQLQNVRIDGVHARDQVAFSDNHPDIVQTWGSVGELRIDRLEGSTDYQGLFFKSDFNGPHGSVDLRNVAITGDPTARYLLWMSDQGGSYPEVSLENVYVQPAEGRRFGKAIWPDVDNTMHPAQLGSDSIGTYAAWPSLPVSGRVYEGTETFVTDAGIGYVSPGYE